MKKCLGKIFTIDILRETLRFIALVFALNYFSESLQEATNELLSGQYINSETQQREVFSTFNGLMLIQKLTVLLFSWCLIKAKTWLNQMTQNHSDHIDSLSNIQQNQTHQVNSVDDQSPRSQDEQNVKITVKQYQGQSFQFSPKTELILGVSSFVAVQIFSQLQQTLNIYYLVQFKYLSTVIIIIVGHLTFRPLEKEAVRTSLCKKLFYAVPIIVLSMLVKLNLTGIPGFYMGNLGSSTEGLTNQLIAKITGLVLMDVVFYSILYVTKQKYFEKLNSQSLNLYFSERISPEKILYSISKYLLVCLLLLTLFTGELKILINFAFNYHNFMTILFNLCWLYFLHQYCIYYCFVTYDLHVFLAVMGTIGLYGKIWDQSIRFWNSHSIMALELVVFLCLIMNHAARKKIKERQTYYRTDEFQETFSQIKKCILKAVPFQKITLKQKKFTI